MEWSLNGDFSWWLSGVSMVMKMGFSQQISWYNVINPNIEVYLLGIPLFGKGKNMPNAWLMGGLTIGIYYTHQSYENGNRFKKKKHPGVLDFQDRHWQYSKIVIFEMCQEEQYNKSPDGFVSNIRRPICWAHGRWKLRNAGYTAGNQGHKWVAGWCPAISGLHIMVHGQVSH